MIIVNFIKILLNNYIEFCNSDFFLKPFIAYCISLYLFTHYMIYYFVRIKKKILAGNILVCAFAIGCIIGEILGLPLAWYKDNIYLNSSDINTEISTSLDNSKLNATDSKSPTNEELLKKNTNNTIKWFCIIYTAFHILYSIN